MRQTSSVVAKSSRSAAGSAMRRPSARDGRRNGGPRDVDHAQARRRGAWRGKAARAALCEGPMRRSGGLSQKMGADSSVIAVGGSRLPTRCVQQGWGLLWAMPVCIGLGCAHACEGCDIGADAARR